VFLTLPIGELLDVGSTLLLDDFSDVFFGVVGGVKNSIKL